METDFSNFCWFICTLFNLQASVEDKRVIFAIVSADVSVLIHQEPTLSMSDHHHNDFRVFTGRWPPFDIDKAKGGTRPVTLLFMRATIAGPSLYENIWPDANLTPLVPEAVSKPYSKACYTKMNCQYVFELKVYLGSGPGRLRLLPFITRNTKGVCVGWSWPVWFIVSEQYFCSREKVHKNVKLFGL